jgi:hypothetical protein
MLSALLQEQRYLKQLILRQSEELAEIKKKLA